MIRDPNCGKVVSVNAGLPREVEWRGKIVLTSIFKAPVEGRVQVARLNIAGDRQSDLSVHGGADKAAYAYPSEHYSFWRGELPGHKRGRAWFIETRSLPSAVANP